MPVASTTTAIRALSYGPEVEEMRAMSQVRGRVLSVLSNAFYLQSEMGHIVCVVGPQAEDGPLTLRLSHIRSQLDAVRAEPDARFSMSSGLIAIVGVAQIELGHARSWKAIAPDCVGSAAEQERAAHELSRILLEYSPRTHSPGLARLAAQELKNRSARLARAIEQSSNERIRDAAFNLLGLGPGLTPSGDDIVMGTVAMLLWRAHLGMLSFEQVDRLVQDIRAEAACKRTNLISARLLYYACQGTLYEPAMALGAALIAGEIKSVRGLARRLLLIGSSSGADMAVGMLAGLSSG
jgi:hypothetical protein